jgi:uncharacterized LabA/DUF88 family protein
MIIVADTFNLFHRARNQFNGKIDYEKIIDRLGVDKDTSALFAYGMTIDDNTKFEMCLRHIGFRTHFKRPRVIKGVRLCEWGIQMFADIINNIDEHSEVIFCTCNFNIVPIIKYLKNIGRSVIICGIDIPEGLAKFADKTIEITEEDTEE